MRNITKEVEISVVIVCMNNLTNLLPCLDSLITQTRKSSYEIFVIAYLFSEENLQILKSKFPEVIIIESVEKRGFSENNNLALRQAHGKYCFVLNDDTVMNMPVLDLLVASFEKEPKASFMSPKTIYSDGRLQSCGRPPITIWTYFLSALRMWKEQKIKSKYINQKGIFQSYNINGAAFMVKTLVLKELGYFDEVYFFCPEDIALSTLANKSGYKCFVNESVTLVHLESGTAKYFQTATHLAALKGMTVFLGSTPLKKMLITGIIFFEFSFKMIYWFFNITSKCRKLNLKKYFNSLKVLFHNESPKEIFKKYSHNI
ncbi:MAG: glycosyltransferase [Mariniphaga sp.]